MREAFMPAARSRGLSPEAAGRPDGAGGFLALIEPSALHEFHALRAADAAAALGFVMALSLSLAKGRPVLWARHAAADAEHGAPYAPGLREMGIDPSRLILLRSRDVVTTLQGALEGARCAALGGVLVELRGEASFLDLTASRRFLLAARRSGASVLLLRSEAEPRPSAAETRWRIRSAPSLPLPAKAPGRPAFELDLLRRKKGGEGLRFVGEWNRDAGCFEERVAIGPSLGGPDGEASGPAAPLHGALVPFPVDRQGPAHATQERRKA
jgi:protein ImuA